MVISYEELEIMSTKWPGMVAVYKETKQQELQAEAKITATILKAKEDMRRETCRQRLELSLIHI